MLEYVFATIVTIEPSGIKYFIENLDVLKRNIQSYEYIVRVYFRFITFKEIIERLVNVNLKKNILKTGNILMYMFSFRENCSFDIFKR